METIREYYFRLLPELNQSPEAWETLEACLETKFIGKGGFLQKAGEVCRHVSFVNSGILRMYYLVDGKEMAVGFAREGDYTADYVSFLTQRPADYSIDALEDTEVVNLGYESMQRLYQQHPVLQIFGRRIAEALFIILSDHNTSLLVKTPEERYQRLVSMQSQLMQRVPQYMLASYLGITPEHLSRIRRKMRDSGTS